jgi:hypothetical protein
MLKLCFTTPSYSIYNDVADIASNPEVRETVGHIEYEGEWNQFFERAGASEELFFIKTHEPPLDSSKAIYIVRHPYRAITSFCGYLEKIGGLDAGMEQTICAHGLPFPSWGTNLDEWAPLSRPDTLLLKYEDIIENPESVVVALERFLGWNRVKDWVNPFNRLQGIMPDFFVQGATSSLGLDPVHAGLIDLLYGDWMEALGYAGSAEPPGYARFDRILAASVRRFQKETVANRTELARDRELVQVFRQWAEKAERRFCDQRDLAHGYMERVRIAEAALASRTSSGETS